MKKPIRALLLAAGYGTRLRPLTLKKPKCLIEINKKTLLELWLEKLEEIEVEKILINTHYLSDHVDKFLDKLHSGNKKITRFHENELLGTAGTLIANFKFFSDCNGLLIHSDNFTQMKLFNLIKRLKVRHTT